MAPEDDIPNLPLFEDDMPETEDVKPTWRGWIHAGTFPVTIVAGIVLLLLAEGEAARWSSFVFVLSSMLLFGNSAL
jgi:hemolysin III